MKLATLLLILAGPALAGAADDAKARKALVGVWKGRVQDGATGHIITFTTTHVSGEQGGNDLGEGKFVLDLTKKPRVMDATGTRGSDKGQTYLGIYSLEGDTLKWCVSPPGNERPTELKTSGSNFCLILKRHKK
ncbi:TIGR03067 domain-containing protein [bacterium]|nr:TIGR03067 domain-containing protein [bacterium]